MRVALSEERNGASKPNGTQRLLAGENGPIRMLTELSGS